MTLIKDTNFYRYFEQCRILNFAAEENLKLFILDTQKPVQSTAEHLKGLGLFQASLLLRAIALENLIKSRVLFQMEKDNTLDAYGSIKEVINKAWGKNSHNILKLCKNYEIDLDKDELKFITNHIDHMHWAGRFPFPKGEVQSNQSLGEMHNYEMNKIISRFAGIMDIDLDKL